MIQSVTQTTADCDPRGDQTVVENIERLATQLGLALDETEAEWGCVLTPDCLAASQALVVIDRTSTKPASMPPQVSDSPDSLLLAAFKRSQPVFANRVTCGVLAGLPQGCPPVKAFAIFPTRLQSVSRAVLVVVNPMDAFASPVVNRLHARMKMCTRTPAMASTHPVQTSDDVSVVFQPQWHLLSGRLYGVEAFARWPDQDAQSSSRSRVDDLARQTMPGDAGDHIMRLACRHWAVWERQKLIEPGINLSLNVSAEQLHTPSFTEQLAALLAEHRIAAHRVVLDIEEAVWHEHSLQPVFDELKRIGIKMALDRFGTGQSTLSMLAGLPLDQLKLGGAFLTELDVGSRNSYRGEAVIQAIVELAKSLVLPVIAVGIENAAIRNKLTALGCTAGQGYALAPPLPATEMQALLELTSQTKDQIPGTFVNLGHDTNSQDEGRVQSELLSGPA